MKKSKTPPPPAETPQEFFAKKIKENFKYSLVFAPSRVFARGDKVKFGNLDNVTVLDKTPDERFYLLETIVPEHRNDPAHIRLDVLPWYEIRPLQENNTTAFLSPVDIRYSVTSRDMSGLFNMVEHMGVDFAPDYQRGFVWSVEQKQNLIASVFDKGNIGSFSFNRRSYEVNAPLYEIVDGKQRLSSLVEFCQDQFTFKGCYFSELSRGDQHALENHRVQVYTLENASKKEILQMFLLINRRGTPVDEAHIEAVEKMLASMTD